MITGDDYQMLTTDTPSSKKKVSALAISIFIPTILWFVNGFLLSNEVLGNSIASSFIVGLVAALVIFLIEKLIIMSNGSIALTIFRGILAFLVAILGSVFLDEVIFVKDINQQLTINKELLLEQKQSGTKQKYSSEIAKLEQEVAKKYNTWQSRQVDAQKEADGSGGSGVKGVHAIARLKLDNATINHSDYLEAKSELEALNVQFHQEQKKVKSGINSSFENNALLNRIKAMFDLVVSDVYMLIFYIVITLVLFALEFLVIFFKITMKKTNYEYRLELIEEIGRKRMDKLRQHDIAHFEPGKNYSSYKNAKERILKTNGSSIFN